MLQIIPLLESLTKDDVLKCARYVSFLFREPGDKLPPVDLKKEHLSSCPSVKITAPALWTDIQTLRFECHKRDDIYDEANFRCLDGKYFMINVFLKTPVNV